MVRRVLKFVYSEVQGLHQAAYILAGLTLGSQVLALLRDRLLTHTFGAGSELDLYFAAFRIPDLLFVFFASALSVYVLIPFIAERSVSGSFEKARALLSQVFTLFCFVYMIAALCIALALPLLVPYIFPGFSDAAGELTLLTRILLIQPFLLGLSGIFAVVSQLQHRFVLYAISPLLYNIGIIAGILFLYPILGLQGVVLGVVLGAGMHMFVQLPYVRDSGLLPTFVRSLDWVAIRSILVTSFPRALTLSAQQIVLLVLVSLASLMTVGSVAALQLAFNLQSVPLAIIGVSYSVAAFPTLAKLYAEGERTAFTEYLAAGIRHILFWSVPLLALLIVVRAQFVRTILGTGAFDWDDTRLVAAALALFVVSLFAQSIYLLFTRAFYAVGNTQVPLISAALSAVVTISSAYGLFALIRTYPDMYIVFEQLLRVERVAGAEMLVLPLAYTIGMFFAAAVLFIAGYRAFTLPLRKIGISAARALAASCVGGTVAYAVLAAIATIGERVTVLQVLTQGAIASILGMVAVIGVYAILGSPELSQIGRALHRRAKARPAVALDETPRD